MGFFVRESITIPLIVPEELTVTGDELCAFAAKKLSVNKEKQTNESWSVNFMRYVKGINISCKIKERH
jgi:hypothetical protein